MPDREKVIKGLECCLNVQSGWKDAVYVCPVCLYGKDDGFPCVVPLMEDAIALLKAQEPVLDDKGVYHCVDCRHPVGYINSGGVLFPHCFYCPKCGRAVKWNDA